MSLHPRLCQPRQTEAEAESNIAVAIRECLAVRAELGMPLTVTTREVEVAV